MQVMYGREMVAFGVPNEFCIELLAVLVAVGILLIGFFFGYAKALYWRRTLRSRTRRCTQLIEQVQRMRHQLHLGVIFVSGACERAQGEEAKRMMTAYYWMKKSERMVEERH